VRSGFLFLKICIKPKILGFLLVRKRRHWPRIVGYKGDTRWSGKFELRR
jgi:hypothetical protein